MLLFSTIFLPVRTDNGANVKPKAEYRHCAGKISNIIYKPSVQ